MIKNRLATEGAIALVAKKNEEIMALQKEMAETDLSKLNAEVKKLGELGPQLCLRHPRFHDLPRPVEPPPGAPFWSGA